MKKMSIDELWDYLDEKWQWVAMDKSDVWYAYRQKPKPVSCGEWDIREFGSGFESIPLSLDYSGPWEDSLVERPKKKVMVFKTKDSIVLSMPEYIAWEGPFPSEAPPEVAEWYHKVMEESK